MPKAGSPSTTSRRALLRAAPAIAASAPLAALAAHPDAALIARCEALIAAEHAQRALIGTCHTIAEEAAAEGEVDHLTEVIDAAAEDLCAMTPTTLEGARALARASVEIGPLRADFTPIAHDRCDQMRLNLVAWVMRTA